MDAGWRIELLSGLRAVNGARVLTRFETRQTASLLAYLACHLHRHHPRDALVEILWPGADPRPARHRLNTALSSLRRQIQAPGSPAGPVLLADTLSVRLNPALVVCDVAEFDAALRAPPGNESPDQRVQRLARALDLYRGELLPGYCEDWIPAERARLAEAYFEALRRLIADLEAIGAPEQALEPARRGVLLDPLREEAQRDLIRLLATTGCPEAALRQYRELERLLKEELDATPTATTRELVRQIRRLADEKPAILPALQAPGRPSPRSRRRSPRVRVQPSQAPDLPPSFTRFFGREEEIGCLLDLLGDGEALPGRLLTLTGPGGSGKTRLALEVARRLAEGSGRAVVWAPLPDLTDGKRIVEAIADALQLMRPFAGGVEEPVIAALSRAPYVLLVDNLEHLLDEGAPLIRRLLGRVPGLLCLVTSRQRLNLEGEREFPVPPLPVPAGGDALTCEELLGYPGVQLFVDRAGAASPGFQLTPANAGAVASLCERLEGIPLAIELAAARAGVLAPAQIVAGLRDRFGLLVAPYRDVPDRHRTLWGALDWSYRLLAPERQQFLARLSVFQGGWTAEAAAAVCEVEPAAALQSLEELRGSSLVQTEERSGELRFRMLETLREFGREHLGKEEWGDARERHARYYVGLAGEAEAGLMGEGMALWLDRLEGEHENLRAALAWTLERGAAEMGLRLAGALLWFWWVRGYHAEGLRWFKSVIDLSRDAPEDSATRDALRAKALWGAGGLAFLSGSREDLALAEESIAISRRLGAGRLLAPALVSRGLVAGYDGDDPTAWLLTEEAMQVARTAGDAWSMANAACQLGGLAGKRGDWEKAETLLAESERLFREIGFRLGVVWVQDTSGTLALQQGNLETARARFEESLRVREELGERFGFAAVYLDLGTVARLQGELSRARALYVESLRILQFGGCRRIVARVSQGLAGVAIQEGNTKEAARLLGFSAATLEATGMALDPWERREYERAVVAARAALGDDAFTAVWEAGRRLTLDDAIAEATAGS